MIREFTTNDWYFRRMDDEGTVQIQSESGDVLTLEWNLWCSLIADMSRIGESGRTGDKPQWLVAKEFHNG